MCALSDGITLRAGDGEGEGEGLLFDDSAFRVPEFLPLIVVYVENEAPAGCAS
jgi:hypothetical protein